MMGKSNTIGLLILMLFCFVACRSTQQLTKLPNSLILKLNETNQYSFVLKESNQLSKSTKVFLQDATIVELQSSKIEVVLKQKKNSMKVPNPDDYRLLLHLKLKANKLGTTKLYIKDTTNLFEKEITIEVVEQTTNN